MYTPHPGEQFLDNTNSCPTGFFFVFGLKSDLRVFPGGGAGLGHHRASHDTRFAVGILVPAESGSPSSVSALEILNPGLKQALDGYLGPKLKLNH
jgi:hypothetical protein